MPSSSGKLALSRRSLRQEDLSRFDRDGAEDESPQLIEKDAKQ